MTRSLRYYHQCGSVGVQSTQMMGSRRGAQWSAPRHSVKVWESEKKHYKFDRVNLVVSWTVTYTRLLLSFVFEFFFQNYTFIILGESLNSKTSLQLRSLQELSISAATFMLQLFYWKSFESNLWKQLSIIIFFRAVFAALSGQNFRAFLSSRE